MGTKAKFLFKYSPAFTLLALNFTVAALWGVSLLLQKVGVPYFTVLFGTLALLSPGLCLALSLEQLSEAKTKPLIFLLWVILLSFVVTPAAVFGISEFLLKQSPVTHIISPFLIWWALCFAGTAVVIFVKRQPTTFSLSFDRVTQKEVAAIFGGYVTILLLNFILYPLLPEGDGYAYLVKWENIQVDPRLLAAETRSLFLIFINLCSRLLNIDPYWIFKAFLPLSHVIIVLSCYAFGRNFITDSRYRILLSLSPLFFPVILQEILMSRPQSILLISFLPSVVLVSEIVGGKENIRQVYWLVALTIIGAMGMKIHTLFALIAFVGLVSIVIFLRREIMKQPLDSLVITLVLLAILYPYLSNIRIILDSWDVITLFATTLRHSHFELWFIDHYRNVDGIEAGWPDTSALFYYGYNLGVAFPVLFIWLIARKKVATFKFLLREKYWPVIFLFVFFLFIAEIAPRFQIAYLPDRAWLFMALLFALVLPVMMKELLKNTGVRFMMFIVAVSSISIVAGTGLTYAKQGWVTRPEVEAGEFIKEQTAEDAVFLGQGSTRVMIRYYGKRSFAHPPEAVFLTGERSALEAYLRSQEAPYREAVEIIAKRRANLNDKLSEMYREKGEIDLTDRQVEEFLGTLSIIRQQKDNYFLELKRLKDLYPTIDRPIYLVYNQNKFDSLYGQRDWWRSSNFYGAKLSRLNENYPVVYNKDGIVIWEARK